MFSYKTKGTCSKEIQIDIDDSQNIVNEIQFIGGCPGNTHGISVLVKGRHIDELITMLKGIDCGGRGTSCPDQLAKALIQYKENQ